MGKLAGRRVTFHAPARIGAIAASLAAAAALLLPSTAVASNAQIGSLSGSAPTVFTCPSGIDSVQSMSGGASYSVPSGGTITQWSIQAGAADAGSAALEVWRATTTPTVYQLVGISALEPLTAGTVNTFDLSTSPITVAPGDLLGLHVEGAVSCFIYTGNLITGAADSIQFGNGPTPGVNGTETLDQPGQAVQLNVVATVGVTTTPNPVPTTANQCKGGGWQKLTDAAGTSFKNQGDCVSFVATDGTNLAG
jgi:hypothetical protein